MPIVGIDLGCDTTILATVGRGGVSIIRNDIADRLTPTVVGYTQRERFIGDAAVSQYRAVYQSCSNRSLKLLLGATTENQAQLLKHEETVAFTPMTKSQLFPDQIAFDISSVRQGEAGTVSTVEVAIAFLKKMKSLAEKFINAPVTNCVITIPNWYTSSQRSALLKASELAGIPCLRTMNEHLSIALDYGLFRASTFEADKPFLATFVDIGYATTKIFAVEYFPSRLTVLALREEIFGGRDLDWELARYCAAAFDQKAQPGASPIMASQWAKFKIVQGCEKAKKVLSANREASVHIECIRDDRDLNVNLTREVFDEICAPHVARLRGVISEFLAGLAPETRQNLRCVEICGGTCRVPWIQKELEAAFQTSLSRTVNPDEAPARGAAVQCAMLDPRHKVREFVLVDKLMKPITLRLLSEAALEPEVHGKTKQPKFEPALSETKNSDGSRNYELFPAGTPFKFVQWITFASDRSKSSIVFALYEAGMAAGQQCLVGEFEVCVPADVSCRPNSKVKVQITLDLNGLVQVGDCLHVEEKTEIQKVKELRPPKEAAPQVIEPGATDTPAPAAPQPMEEVEVEKTVKSLVKTALTVTCRKYPAGHLSDKDVQKLVQSELKSEGMDAKAEECRNRLNDLQSLCYDTRESILQESGADRPFANAAELEQIAVVIEKTTEWIDYEADDFAEHPELLKDKYEVLRGLLRPVSKRREEAERRRRWTHKLNKLLDNSPTESEEKSLGAWITETQRQTLAEAKDKLRTWLVGVAATEATTPPSSDTFSVTSADIEHKHSDFKTQYEKEVTAARGRRTAAEKAEAEAKKKAEAEALAEAAALLAAEKEAMKDDLVTDQMDTDGSANVSIPEEQNTTTMA